MNENKVKRFFDRNLRGGLVGRFIDGEIPVLEYLFSLWKKEQFPPYDQERLVIPPTIMVTIGGVEYQYARVDNETEIIVDTSEFYAGDNKNEG